MKIENISCQEKQGSIMKRTQVVIDKKRIIVEDSYKFHLSNMGSLTRAPKFGDNPTISTCLPEINHYRTEERKDRCPKRQRVVLKNPIIREHFNKINKHKYSKNLVKNFFKAFINFLNEKGEVATITMLEEMSKSTLYNNRLIKKIADVP